MCSTEKRKGRQMTGLGLQNCSRLAVAAIVVLTLGNTARAATCDRACLLQQATRFNDNMLAHTTGKIPLARGAEIRENSKAISLDASKWGTVKQIRSEGVFADPVLGNVIEHVAAETDAGKIVYIGTRLKIVDGEIKEVEINYDDRPEVNAKNLIPYALQRHRARRRAFHSCAAAKHHHLVLPRFDRPQAD
jgi:hypothetical protein